MFPTPNSCSLHFRPFTEEKRTGKGAVIYIYFIQWWFSQSTLPQINPRPGMDHMSVTKNLKPGQNRRCNKKTIGLGKIPLSYSTLKMPQIWKHLYTKYIIVQSPHIPHYRHTPIYTLSTANTAEPLNKGHFVDNIIKHQLTARWWTATSIHSLKVRSPKSNWEEPKAHKRYHQFALSVMTILKNRPKILHVRMLFSVMEFVMHGFTDDVLG